MKIKSFLILITAFWSGWVFAHQTLLLSESTRLEANIAPHVMNRISVLNDRISSVFGDEGSFETQTDEQTGQIFIKPSADNGKAPLSMSLITENGLTQDLLLHPVSEKPNTIILKPVVLSKETKKEGSVFPKSHTFQTELVQIIKQAMLNQLPVKVLKNPTRKKVRDLKVSFLRSFSASAGNPVVSVWMVQNKGQETLVLDAKNFYQRGDWALSFEKNELLRGQKTVVYVVSSSDVY